MTKYSGIKAMQEYISQAGSTPVDPFDKDGTLSSRKLGKLGEQYTCILFNGLEITKIREKQTPTPDFDIRIDNRVCKLEVKTVSKLFESTLNLIFEVLNEIENENLFKTIIKNYDFRVNPLEVHRDHLSKFKETFRENLVNFNSKHISINFEVSCDHTNYQIDIERKKELTKGIYSVFSGYIPDKTKTLANKISSDRWQIGLSDLLLIILEDTDVKPTDLMELFYRPVGQVITFTRKEGDPAEDFTQFLCDKSVWGLKYSDENGKFHCIGDNLKCIVVLYPSIKKSVLFPSYKLFDDFNCAEYTLLKHFLETKGFETNWVCHDIKLWK